MACPNPFAAIQIATEHLGSEIYGIPTPATPYFNFVERGVFPRNMGVTMSTFIAGRVEPDSKSAGWSAVTLDSAGSGSTGPSITGGICADSFTSVPVGFDTLQYSPRKLQLQGPSICRDTLSFAHQPMKFIQQHYIPSLAHYVKRKIDLEFRDQIIKFSNKMSLAAGGFSNVVTASTNPTVKPTSQLNWTWLDGVAVRLIGDGAANSDGEEIEMGPDGPVFPAFIGLEALNRLFQNGSATSPNAFRQDFQYADSGKGAMAQTLKSIGASRQIKNFRFAPVVNPPRFTWNNSTLVEVEQFEFVSATHGQKSTETSAYQNAEYEAIVIPHRRQFKADILTPDYAGLDYEPSMWTGDWKFITGGERIVSNNVCFDPMHKWGAHFAEFIYAPEPIHTNYGWVLFYKRCQNDQSLTVCTSGL